MSIVDESYVATVSAVDDPEQRGRIRCSCVGLLGDEDGDLPMWIEPETLWGWFVVPDVGEIVEIVATKHGDVDDCFGQTSISSLNVRWRGARYWTSEEAEKPRDVPDDFKINYGKRRGFCTPQGHVLLFDDTPGKERVALSWHAKPGGVDAYGFYTIDEHGSLICSNRNGSVLYFNAVQRQCTWVDEHGNSITTDADGTRIIDHFGNVISTQSGVIQIISQGNVVVTGNDFNVVTGSYNLGQNPQHSAVLGEPLLTWLNTHTHTTPVGPSGPPIVPAPPSLLSVVGKLQ